MLITISIIPLIFSCGTQKETIDNREENSSQLGEIAYIKAASGISYCHKNNTLMVASDNGKIYEITQSGDILSKYTIGNYDFEGIICKDKELILAIEGSGLLRFNRETHEIDIFPLEGATDIKMSNKHGIEGLIKIGDYYYLSIQSKKKKNAKLLKVLLDKSSATVISTLTTNIIDMSGLEYHNGELYILSDINDALYRYNLKNKEILEVIPLPEFAQEGVAFSSNSDIFFANDDGSIFHYKLLKDKNELIIK